MLRLSDKSSTVTKSYRHPSEIITQRMVAIPSHKSEYAKGNGITLLEPIRSTWAGDPGGKSPGHKESSAAGLWLPWDAVLRLKGRCTSQYGRRPRGA